NSLQHRERDLTAILISQESTRGSPDKTSYVIRLTSYFLFGCRKCPEQALKIVHARVELAKAFLHRQKVVRRIEQRRLYGIRLQCQQPIRGGTDHQRGDISPELEAVAVEHCARNLKRRSGERRV